jgi:enamine deaminase RidA (YjgF/YER057c/UK114 family)
MPTIAARLKELGLTLPEPASPAGSYVPFVVTGNLVFVAGQLPRDKGQVAAVGRLGAEIDLATGYKAARICALNILAQVNAACGGDLDRVEQCVRLGGFVASAPDFYDHPKVVNGASELIEKIFGARGRHARAAVGVYSLPMNAAVEVDAIFSLRAYSL